MASLSMASPNAAATSRDRAAGTGAGAATSRRTRRRVTVRMAGFCNYHGAGSTSQGARHGRTSAVPRRRSHRPARGLRCAGRFRSRPARMGRGPADGGRGTLAGGRRRRRRTGHAGARQALRAGAGRHPELHRSAQVVQPGGQPRRDGGAFRARCCRGADDAATGRGGAGAGRLVALWSRPDGSRARGADALRTGTLGVN